MNRIRDTRAFGFVPHVLSSSEIRIAGRGEAKSIPRLSDGRHFVERHISKADITSGIVTQSYQRFSLLNCEVHFFFSLLLILYLDTTHINKSGYFSFLFLSFLLKISHLLISILCFGFIQTFIIDNGNNILTRIYTFLENQSQYFISSQTAQNALLFLP